MHRILHTCTLECSRVRLAGFVGLAALEYFMCAKHARRRRQFTTHRHSETPGCGAIQHNRPPNQHVCVRLLRRRQRPLPANYYQRIICKSLCGTRGNNLRTEALCVRKSLLPLTQHFVRVGGVLRRLMFAGVTVEMENDWAGYCIVILYVYELVAYLWVYTSVTAQDVVVRVR